jgi:hypothetical protein
MEGFDKAKYEAELAAADQDDAKKAEIQAGKEINIFVYFIDFVMAYCWQLDWLICTYKRKTF